MYINYGPDSLRDLLDDFGVPNKDKVQYYKSANPQMRAAEIARRVGISRERVRQILTKLGLPTQIERVVPKCSRCSRPICRENDGGLCVKCISVASKIILRCDWCGQQKEERRKYYDYRVRRHNRRYTFCNRTCLGKWFGANYGFGPQRRAIEKNVQ